MAFLLQKIQEKDNMNYSKVIFILLNYIMDNSLILWVILFIVLIVFFYLFVCYGILLKNLKKKKLSIKN